MQIFSGYFYVLILVWLLSGFILLKIDVNKYGQAKMAKEMKVSRALGWCNIILGFLFFLGGMIYRLLV